MASIENVLTGNDNPRDVGLALLSWTAWVIGSFLFLALVLRPAVLFPPPVVDLASLPGVASAAADLQKLCPVPDGLFAVKIPKDWIVRWAKSGNHLVATEQYVEDGNLVVGFDGAGKANWAKPRVVGLLRPRLEKIHAPATIDLLRPVIAAGMHGFEFRARGDKSVLQQVELHKDGKRLVFTASSPSGTSDDMEPILHAVAASLTRAKNF